MRARRERESMKLGRPAANVLLVGISVAVGLLVCEAGSRVVLRPADYLSVELVEDRILGRALPPGSSGYDEWGFRNRNVPSTVDVVAIGDSHTFGNTAKMDESWPYVLGRLTGRSVYNLAMGGYGPNQYYYLFKTKALALRPRVILCGLYMGDDFDNAFRITYGLEYWAFLRAGASRRAESDIWEMPPTSGWHNRMRTWLSRHSVIYQIVFHGPLLGRLTGRIQVENAARLYDSTASLIIRRKNIVEAFAPTGPLRGLAQGTESVKEGIRITLRLLREMNEIAEARGIRFVVVVIPTKETVFAEYLGADRDGRMAGLIRELISSERVARTQVFEAFRTSGIRYVDVLPALKNAVEKELYVRSGRDMHPGKNGYRIIGEAVAKALAGQRLEGAADADDPVVGESAGGAGPSRERIRAVRSVPAAVGTPSGRAAGGGKS
jgi:acetyltransferase AlgX (SGNH hydrolase-like protein)